MSLTLYFHPLSSFCMKVLVALYETETAFERRIVNLADEAERAALLKIWPIGRFPVLRDETADRTIPESNIIIEYLAHHHPGRTTLVPADPDLARQTRLRDRFYDLYVNTPMQKVVTDKLRPATQNDPYGVEQAKALLHTAYAMIDDDMRTNTWAMGDAFTMADCAAAPALFYAGKVVPFGDGQRNLAAYLGRLVERPSFARVLAEAQPYFAMFPG
jgi:glutathione S-transferase